MLGKFQQSHLRLEIPATKEAIANSLLVPANLSQWLWFFGFPPGLPEKFQPGFTFTSRLGPLAVHYCVEVAAEDCLRLELSGAIDGHHEWYWGNGWVQSRLEGISLLPLNLGQTASLLSLREFLHRQSLPESRALT
ncbi:MAG: hypothetical protein HC890_19810 [Chloroflexaceae bacterium]|nr:hypothetical protein [Chloroflexaceae bacterium]